MKTNITIAAISFLMITLLSVGRYATAETTGNDTLSASVALSLNSSITIEDEDYINDIPFDTKAIAIESMLTSIQPTEETYINDIPFDTESIAASSILMKFKPEDEAYVNDIPFNTSNIAKKYSNCRYFASENGNVKCEK